MFSLFISYILISISLFLSLSLAFHIGCFMENHSLFSSTQFPRRTYNVHEKKKKKNIDIITIILKKQQQQQQQVSKCQTVDMFRSS